MTLLEDFLFFCKHQLKSQDVDPVYPLLQYLIREMSEEQALWHTMLYVGYYSLPSCRISFASLPKIAQVPVSLSQLPTGVERRGFRGGAITRHVDSLITLHTTYGSLKNWLCQGFESDPLHNWKHLQKTLVQPWGNGRWAAYKTGEILQKVHDFPVQPTDMGHEFSSGPRHGLALFYPACTGNSQAIISMLDEQGLDLLWRLDSAGVTMGIEQLETMLCDFHALVEGRYYVGHDIDLLQTQISSPSLPSDIRDEIWRARKKALPHIYLGELRGWNGVDQQRKKIYQQMGKVLIRE